MANEWRISWSGFEVVGSLTLEPVHVTSVNFDFAYKPATTDLRATSVTVDFIYSANAPNVRATSTDLELIYNSFDGTPLRVTSFYIEYIAKAPEENKVSTEVIPLDELKGLTFGSVTAPEFSTNIQEHTGGSETATDYWELPRWNFEVSFDYLPNKGEDVDTDLKKLMGFFLDRKGRFDTFLYRHPDDYRVTDRLIFTGDGVEVDVELFRQMGSNLEPIGYLKEDSLVMTIPRVENLIVPAMGPYTATCFGEGTQTITSLTIGGTPLLQVVGAPGPMEYQVNTTTGVFTFNAAQASDVAVLTYTYIAKLGIHFTFLAPRTVHFLVAPPNGVAITASYDYYFVCRFKEDSIDVEEFMYKLYELNSLSFKSIVL